MKLHDLHEGQDVIVRLNPVVYGSIHNANDPIFERSSATWVCIWCSSRTTLSHHEQFDVMRI